MKFVSISVTAVESARGVTLYYATVDSHGVAWWWDTDQPTRDWKRLPPHPGRGSTAGSGP